MSTDTVPASLDNIDVLLIGGPRHGKRTRLPKAHLNEPYVVVEPGPSYIATGAGAYTYMTSIAASDAARPMHIFIHDIVKIDRGWELPRQVKTQEETIKRIRTELKEARLERADAEDRLEYVSDRLDALSTMLSGVGTFFNDVRLRAKP